MGSGRGEQLAPVFARGTFHWVFAISDTGLSTPQVYASATACAWSVTAVDVGPSRT